MCYLLSARSVLELLHAYLFLQRTISVWIRYYWAHFTGWRTESQKVHIVWSGSNTAGRDCPEMSIETCLTPKLLQWLHLQCEYFLTDRERGEMWARLNRESGVHQRDWSMKSTCKVRKQKLGSLSPPVVLDQCQGPALSIEFLLTVRSLWESSCWLLALNLTGHLLKRQIFLCLSTPSPDVHSVWDRNISPRPQFHLDSQPLHARPPPWERRAQHCLKFLALMESSELFINPIMAGDEIFSRYVPVSRCLLICFTSRSALTVGPEESHAPPDMYRQRQHFKGSLLPGRSSEGY